jgi:hypothetical protein
MSTEWKIGPKLALCGIVCGFVLVGWATRYSIAQNSAQKVPLPPTSSGSDSLPKVDEPKSAVPQTKPESTASELAPTLPDSGPADPLAVPSLKGESSPLPAGSTPSAGAPAPVTIGPDHAATEADDPEKVAIAFLEQNQKLADAQLKALKEEAEKLKARLTKVESAIKRWDRLLGALKGSQESAGTEKGSAAAGKTVFSDAVPSTVLSDPNAPSAEPAPTDLSPIHTEPGPVVPQSSKAAVPVDDRGPR